MKRPRGRFEAPMDDYHDTGRSQPGHEKARPSATTAIDRAETGNGVTSEEAVPSANGIHQAGRTMFSTTKFSPQVPAGFEPHYPEIAHEDGSWMIDTEAAPDWWTGPAVDWPGVAVAATWHPNSGVSLTGPEGEYIDAAQLPAMARQLLELHAAVRAAGHHMTIPGVTGLEHEQDPTKNGGDR